MNYIQIIAKIFKAREIWKCPALAAVQKSIERVNTLGISIFAIHIGYNYIFKRNYSF